MHNFKDLKVWIAGIGMCKEIFQLTKAFPDEEKFGLTSQMKRAAISIPSNIAEGCGRKSNKEFYQFLNVALGSSFELETQLIIAYEFAYITQQTLGEKGALITEIQKMIYGLQKSLTV
ncbi:diversity-generating retroelement protein bAvd family protein [Mucilaginibacter hurinus]|uniref:Diversity-generating retroelement protein bAvd family protein n=1 Tax=Mucilaginibacter hurinus TaxID=2201324 RepID=A0A367GK16_9SPHI|nr:four helix bundle protein [Mucilaginibacter hurinus]RCH53817.1 diversity-generating retroelement protein bAvd family protein [Mucilaginibacter hurinus]